MTADTASLKTLSEERWNVLVSRRSHLPDASTSGLAVPPTGTKRGDIIASLCLYIDGCDHIPTLHELSQLSSVSPYHLHRLFCERTGRTPRQYATGRRRKRL